jgi:HSP20 family protein
MKSKRISQKQQPEPPTTLLNLQNVEDLHWKMQQVQLAIARRAYELFETRGCEHGHAWEDWFRAESELLRPVSVSMSESDDRISVRANVLGFEGNELKVGVEPRRLTILGKKETIATKTEGGTAENIDWVPDQILQLIDLATDVIPEGSVVELQAGLLTFELPKAAKHEAKTAAAAAQGTIQARSLGVRNPSAAVKDLIPMKRASQQLIKDSAETANQFETTAQLLEDLAVHADSGKERQRCLAAARDFRRAAQNKSANR